MPKLANLAQHKDSLSALQSIASIVGTLITSLAILVGGIWFLQQGLARKRLVVQQTLKTFAYENDMHLRLLSVSVVATNTGHVPVRLTCMRVQITELIPEYKRDLSSPDLKKPNDKCNVDVSTVEIDPGEVNPIYKEFYIPDTSRAIRVATFLPDQSENDFGWWSVETINISTTRTAEAPQPARKAGKR